MRPIRISIPSKTGSFHHEAAMNYFGDNVVVAHCENMRDALERVASNAYDYALLACENTSAGFFYETYRLIDHSGLFIIDEISVPVNLCLATNEGINLQSIRTVLSHPYAILQAKEKLAAIGLQSFSETPDTISAVDWILENPYEQLACICNQRIAHERKLRVLLNDVQKSERNYTRFFVIGKGSNLHTSFNKVVGVATVQLQSTCTPAISFIIDRINSEIYFEALISDGVNSNLLTIHRRKIKKILGHAVTRKPNDQVNHQIHISL